MDDEPTGAAFIYVNDSTGDNAIIVYPGAAGTIGVDDVEAAREAIRQSAVFVTQLEQPAVAALHALAIARAARVTTIFNPAPAETFPEAMLDLCDYIIPNDGGCSPRRLFHRHDRGCEAGRRSAGRARCRCRRHYARRAWRLLP